MVGRLGMLQKDARGREYFYILREMMKVGQELTPTEEMSVTHNELVHR